MFIFPRLSVYLKIFSAICTLKYFSDFPIYKLQEYGISGRKPVFCGDIVSVMSIHGNVVRD